MLKKRTNGVPRDASVETPMPTSSGDNTIIGENVTVEGSIRGNGNLIVEGAVKGTIELHNHQLTVGKNGKVEAEIQAGSVSVSGKVLGNIKAGGRVRITREADFRGEIKASGISIEDGAYLKAVIELDREGVKKSPAALIPG